MKNVLVSFAILTLGLVGMAEAKSRVVGSPKATTGEALQTADYGGFDVSTSAFSAEFTTATLNTSGVFAGVIFSTDNTAIPNFVDVYDSSSTDKTTGRLLTRIYDQGGSTAGFSGPDYPMRFKNGLIFKPNVATYNMINVLYNAD